MHDCSRKDDIFLDGRPFEFYLVKILTSSLQMTNSIQKKFKVSSTQLLYQSCPYQAATLLISGPYLDKFLTALNVFTFKYTRHVTVRFKMTLVLTVELKCFFY